MNPKIAFYSCFPRIHHTYSQNDDFLISASLVYTIKVCNYDSVLISDHATNNLISVELGQLSPKRKSQEKKLSVKCFVSVTAKHVKTINLQPPCFSVYISCLCVYIDFFFTKCGTMSLANHLHIYLTRPYSLLLSEEHSSC